jgi:hypothetical protein
VAALIAAECMGSAPTSRGRGESRTVSCPEPCS